MSVVLLTGSSGFIGTRLRSALRDAGHRVIAMRRGSNGQGAFSADFTRDAREMHWRPRLVGVDVVVNAAGVFVDRPRGSMKLIHAATPKALFSAAAESGVRRIIQISALGADSRSTEYFETKDEADRHLMTLPIEWAILRPSLVFGLGGRSATLLLRLATLPAVILPRAFRCPVQPVHIDDLVAAVLALVAAPQLPREPVAVAGGKACSMKEFLDILRRQLGYRSAPVMVVPDAIMRLLGRLTVLGRQGYLTRDALRMLRAGHTANAASLATLLGRWPRSPENFVPRGLAVAVGSEATLGWLLPPLRWTIAALWIWSAVVSLGVFPVAESHAVLARTGIPAAMQGPALLSAGALDLAVGLSVLLFPRQALVWSLQITLVIAYTVVISIWLPEYWLHPLGPVAKNLPLLAFMYLLRRLSLRTWNS
ncbi:MAG TPA: SDR family oxidoreductase [Steroidobacteraceae bacterium]|nr:SDR family oxidoreductase [Steroidobacteraceae bacterium]